MLPFSAAKDPHALKQTTFMKMNKSIKQIAAKCITKLRENVVGKEEKIMFNDLEGSILAVSPLSKRMKSL